MLKLAHLFSFIQPQRRTDIPMTRLPKALIWVVLVICVIPLWLNLLGIDFGSPLPPPELSATGLSAAELTDVLHHHLSGSFVHTLLEWSAFCAAIFTAVLAFSHFSIKQDVTTPIIGVALLCAGSMDAFHTLAADRLIAAVADNRDLIPFTWVMCRLCNVLLTLLGVGLCFLGKPRRWQQSVGFVVVASLGLGLFAYSVIQICATSDRLPQTMYPDAWIHRPWDIVPLVLFAIAGLFIYPRFYQQYPSVFSHALIVSTIPNAATQLHMAFGSSALFDNHFNIAHFLKIIAYLVPLAGLILDYTYTHRQVKQMNDSLSHEIEERKQVQRSLEQSEQNAHQQSQQLGQALQELQQTHHDLQQTQFQLIQSEKMSSLGQLVAGVAHEINNPVSFIYGNLNHADRYTQELLNLLTLYQQHYPNPAPQIQTETTAIDLEFLREDLPKLLNSMKVGADRIRAIVLSLRNFSRMDEAEIKAVNLHEGIDSTLMILQNRLKAKGNGFEIQVLRDYGDLPLVECYPGQLNQVFMNILTNAIDALEDRIQSCASRSAKNVLEEVGDRKMPVSGAVARSQEYQDSRDDVTSRSASLPTPTIRIQTEQTTPTTVQIQIADNGSGMTEATLQRLFDPFFTTKPVGKGTGLGMSISYQIVTEKHCGSLRCNSSPGQGTTFVLEIPIRQPGYPV